MSKQITCNDEQLQVLIDHERGKLSEAMTPTTVEESKAVTRSLKFIENCERGLGAPVRQPRNTQAQSVSADTQE